MGRSVAMALLFILVFSLSAVQKAEVMDHRAQVRLSDAAGHDVGEVSFIDEGGTVRVIVGLQGLPSGWHGFHIHGVGDCTPPAHTSAGGHFNPAGRNHPEHAGDLPLLYVVSDGTVDMSFKTDRFALADLFDADGSAVIIHANPDNYANIQSRYRSSADGAPESGPDSATLATGDAGARIACGVVSR